MQVVGTAQSGEEALERLPAARPQVVTLDVEMPGMGGLATLREIQRRYPRLPRHHAVGAHAKKERRRRSTRLSAGAVDFIDKSRLNVMDFDRLSRELLDKIEVWKHGAARLFLGAHGRARADSPPWGGRHSGGALVVL